MDFLPDAVGDEFVVPGAKPGEFVLVAASTKRAAFYEQMRAAKKLTIVTVYNPEGDGVAGPNAVPPRAAVTKGKPAFKSAPKAAAKRRPAAKASGRTGRPPRHDDGIDPVLLEEYMMKQPNARHTIQSAIVDQVPEGIPSWVNGGYNPRYGRVAQLIRRVRADVEEKTGKKFVPVPRGEKGEVTLRA
jgi:hypothetical protein